MHRPTDACVYCWLRHSETDAPWSSRCELFKKTPNQRGGKGSVETQPSVSCLKQSLGLPSVTQATSNKMPPYNTPNLTNEYGFESYKNAIASPSATGEGIHTRWIYPPNEKIPTLSHSGSLDSEASFDRPVTPDQDEGEEFQGSQIEIPDERASPIVEDYSYSPAERAVMKRMLARLQEQKRVVEERAARMADFVKAQERRNNLQPNSDRPGAEEVTNLQGPKLPLGVVGFGREGTWVVEKAWRPSFVPSTDQLPSIREFEEEQVVQDPLLNNVTQEDLSSRKPDFRMLTPLPSFVTGNGGV